MKRSKGRFMRTRVVGILGMGVFLLISILVASPVSAYEPLMREITIDDGPIMGRPIEPTPDSPNDLSDLQTQRERVNLDNSAQNIHIVISYFKFASYYYQPLSILGLWDYVMRLEP